jgi:hypothetical protein
MTACRSTLAGTAIRQPETIDLNAPGGVRDYVERDRCIYERLQPSQQRRVDWAGPVARGGRAGPGQALPAYRLEERQVWRDRRLVAVVAHKRRAIVT